MPPSTAAVLDALGDPTRRSILEQLRQGPLPVGVLAGHLPVSRPAVSQHLKVLNDAGLVARSTSGTRHLYRVNRSGLQVAHDYLDRFWETTLDSFAAFAAEEAAAEADTEASSAPSRTAPN